MMLPTDGRHVAQLPRRGEKQRLAYDRISFAHAIVPCDIAHSRHRAKAEATVGKFSDAGELRVFREAR